MTRLGRIGTEAVAAARSFTRRRTAVFFTFFFPVILVVIFGALVRTQPTGGGLFAEPAGYYIPGYLAVVVLFTPLSRVGSEIARHRDGGRFEKLATTPLSRAEWLVAHTLVNVGIIGAASLLILGLVVAVTDATLVVSPSLAALPVFVAVAVALFCGLGAVLGALADSQDGVIAASNTVALPLLFLSETFVTPSLLPEWFLPAVAASPLTYFARGARAITFTGGRWAGDLLVLTALAAVFLAVGAYAVPRTE
ncbi:MULTISPECIES: ABC transporter permease [Halorubrum]|jgi:ABC-2 type transport system permease protein|uniref:ABC transporter permease n=1 Tax=Halorubrum tropicale TaxID=1765655 RepID=A0A0N0BQT0_9EURY|nr:MULTISPECIES: ABC transporter permease [Halorubrum]KOX95836.1 ABC transporter permease [Halorubrum tropicale]RLM50135.1 ABC transporter permease [Halorubrum sp. Atlit-28R]TKX44567.1 ABC transporter permease [Halorubrum sp. ARQ200]TKX49094.1 ABC transporter permease [Halorubrum sp. ASP121]TKX62914.1 ABC transporter permease [Halorubrum sp. ASP1]